MRRLQELSERGIALPMALGVMMVLSAALVVVLELTSAGARHSERSRASSNAHSAAEAGVNVALSVLANASDPTVPTLLPTTTTSVDGGSVTYSGSYDSATATWTITATGTVNNPSEPGASDITRTLTQTAVVQPLVPGATPPEWDRLFHARTDVCLIIDTVTIPASVTSAGDLCLAGTGKITGARSKVEVGDNVTLAATPGPVQSPLGNPPDVTSGTAWTVPSYIRTSDEQRATYAILANSQSTNLQARDFDFAIPSNAIILGIEARIERNASGTFVDDEDVFLLKNGSTTGITDHASSDDWPQPSTFNEAYKTYGSPSDLWGTTWTPAQINATNFGLRLRVDNDSSAARTALVNHVAIEVYYRVDVVNASIGLGGAPVSRAEVVGTCQKGSATPNTPCSSVDNVYAGTYTTTPLNLQKPEVDMQFWYENAKPGPNHDCTTGSFPGGFDNNAVMDRSLPDYGNANEDIDQLTPTYTSYTCKVEENGQLVGEVSWNHVTHVLKIKGQIFIDGNVRFDRDGQPVNYQGRAIIYAAGDLEYDEVVCAGGDGTNNCWNDMSNWNPEQNMMIILSGGWSEYDQGDDCCPLRPAAFQGVMYARDECLIHQAFRSSGPILCDEIRIEYNGAWPSFSEWPELQSLIAGQMYGSFANADDYAILLGDQTG